MRNLDNIVNPGKNAFNEMRLLAALSVLVSHAWAVTGHKPEPLLAETGMTLGAHGVNLFFVLSGLMVAASWERTKSTLDFCVNRFIRIFPALIAVTVLLFFFAAFVLTENPSEFWQPLNVGLYFAKHAIMYGDAVKLPGVFEDVPVAQAINSPLWTLRFELMCYISLAALMLALGYLKNTLNLSIRPTVSAIFVMGLSAVWLVKPPYYSDFSFLDHLARFFFAFYFGVLLWNVRGKVWLDFRIAGILFVVALIWTDLRLPYFIPVQIMTLGYIALWFGQFRYEPASSFFDKQDYSYGVYITGFPIQQSLVYFMPGMTIIINASLTAFFAIFLAMVIWNLIERPSFRRKKLLSQSVREIVSMRARTT